MSTNEAANETMRNYVYPGDLAAEIDAVVPSQSLLSVPLTAISIGRYLLQLFCTNFMSHSKKNIKHEPSLTEGQNSPWHAFLFQVV